jgi:hypothetical protein
MQSVYERWTQGIGKRGKPRYGCGFVFLISLIHLSTLCLLCSVLFPECRIKHCSAAVTEAVASFGPPLCGFLLHRDLCWNFSLILNLHSLIGGACTFKLAPVVAQHLIQITAQMKELPGRMSQRKQVIMEAGPFRKEQ